MNPVDATSSLLVWPSLASLSVMAPTLFLFCGAGLSFVLMRFVGDSKRSHISRMWTITILLIAGWIELQTQFSSQMGAILLHDPFSRFFRLVAVSGFTLLAIFLPASADNVKTPRLQQRVLELIYPILLLSVGGVFFLAEAYDLVTLFIGVELCAIPLYLYFRGITHIAETEASHGDTGANLEIANGLRDKFLRFFGYGIFSSLIFLFGLAVLYGIGGETNLLQLRVNISIVFLTYKKIGPSMILAVALLSAGLAAKMGLAPFHLWMGEFHASRRSGALPLAILTGILTGSITFLRVFDNVLIAFSGDVMAPLDWAPALTIILTISMFLTVAAILRERSVRRMLLWIALAQGGFVMIGVISANSAGLSGALIQTMFTVLSLSMLLPLIERMAPVGFGDWQSSGRIAEVELSDLRGLARRSPLIAGVLTLGLASLAAAPFTGGFVARLGLAESALDSQQWWAFSLIVVVSLVILFSIGRLVWSLFQKTEFAEKHSEPGLTMSMRLAAAITCAILIYAGVAPSVVEVLTVQAVSVFGL